MVRPQPAEMFELSMEDASALYNRAVALDGAGQLEPALAAYDAALALKPDFADAHYGRAATLWSLGRHDEALAATARVIVLAPRHLAAHFNRGVMLQATRRPNDALAAYDSALTIRPDFAPALNNRGSVLLELGRQNEALASYERLIAVEPRHADAHNNRGGILFQLGRTEDALAAFDAALRCQPDYPKALLNRSTALTKLRRHAEARLCYQRLLALNPNDITALGGLADVALHLCDFEAQTRLAAPIRALIEAGEPVMQSLNLMSWFDDPALHRRATENQLRRWLRQAPPPLARPPYRHDRIRLAYLSPDFGHHPVAQQLVEVLERHDRDRFEVTGIALRHNDGSDIRARIAHACDHFHDASGESDAAVAALLRTREIDIAIDLAGHTAEARPLIFGHRAAPVQVNYLGFAGTMALPFWDYMIADAVAVPLEMQPFFSERIVHLPHSFWVSDTTRPVVPPPSRAKAGLPPEGVVFAAFNRLDKISRPQFQLWMRLLAAVPQSVLWLASGDEAAAANLRREAGACGIDPVRLIFAPKLASRDDHLARLSLADLFLDTAPYNAHATASDALWAGVPVITCPGTGFASRVAASLLKAIGLAELVTESFADYEALALALAREPERLQALHARLAANRISQPLFDTRRSCRALEDAYRIMWERAERGAAPESFAVLQS
jgi:predicted O-linked N-acetylglucosamine transferase (SPINDLY family)